MSTFSASINWINYSETDFNQFEKKARDHFAGVIETLEFYQDNGPDLDCYEHADKTRRELLGEGYNKEEVREIESIIATFKEIGSFCEYGLGFDFVEANETIDGYYRFQICWGGPSSEIRIFRNCRIEAVYMDWFVGVGFNATSYIALNWLIDFFNDCGMLDWDKPFEELYSQDTIETEFDFEG